MKFIKKYWSLFLNILVFNVNLWCLVRHVHACSWWAISDFIFIDISICAIALSVMSFVFSNANDYAFKKIREETSTKINNHLWNGRPPF